MKPTDIQIGDLLTFEDCLNDEAYPVIKVTGILQDSFFASIDDAKAYDELSYEGVVGIPLTAEILEKNTSESNENIFGGMDYALHADFFIENRGDRFCLSRRVARHKYSSTFWICNIHYVHELQHALRLCGIEKEIVV